MYWVQVLLRLSFIKLVRADTFDIDQTDLEYGIKIAATCAYLVNKLTIKALVVGSTVLRIKLDIIFYTRSGTGTLTIIDFTRFRVGVPIVTAVAGLLYELACTANEVVQAIVGILLGLTIGTAIYGHRAINVPEQKA